MTRSTRLRVIYSPRAVFYQADQICYEQWELHDGVHPLVAYMYVLPNVIFIFVKLRFRRTKASHMLRVKTYGNYSGM